MLNIAHLDLNTQFSKAQLLLAAGQVFAEKGIEATTVQHILEAANISRGTFYKYFRNKQDVLTSLYRFAAALLHEAMAALNGTELSGVEQLHRSIDVFVNFHMQNGKLVQLLQEEAMQTESPLHPLRIDLHERIVQLFDAGVRHTQQRRLDPLVYHSLVLAIEGVSLRLLRTAELTPDNLERGRQTMYAIAGRVLATPDEMSEIAALPILED